jgi:hypothetical protein
VITGSTVRIAQAGALLLFFLKSYLKKYKSYHPMNALKIKGTTGEICQVSGVYYCQHNGHSEIKVTQGEPFPPCLAGEHETEWVLRRGEEKEN